MSVQSQENILSCPGRSLTRGCDRTVNWWPAQQWGQLEQQPLSDSLVISSKISPKIAVKVTEHPAVLQAGMKYLPDSVGARGQPGVPGTLNSYGRKALIYTNRTLFRLPIST